MRDDKIHTSPKNHIPPSPAPSSVIQAESMTRVTWVPRGEGTERPLTIKTKLRAWWEGYDLSVLKLMLQEAEAEEAEEAAQAILNAQGTQDAAPVTADNEPLDRFGRPLWTANRVRVAEKLWGGDFLSPGGVDHITTLVKPFGITSSMSILDLSAGLGGAARAIAEEYKAWVTGMESSAYLAQLAMERSGQKGLAKQAPIEHYTPNALQLPRRYDGIFAKEAFFTVDDKEKLLDTIAKAIKPGGQFLFTDYCLPEDASTLPDSLAGWATTEKNEPHLWTPASLKTTLKKRKLDVRTVEDMTETHKTLTLQAMAHFVEHLDAHALDRATKLAVLDEIELWARRISAMDNGLRVYRFYCMNH